MAYTDKTPSSEKFLTLFDIWARKTPSYEKHYEAEVIKPLTDFGVGTNEASEAKGKILGAGYEVLIMAYFIGLYSNKMSPLDRDEDIKDLGQPIQFWGNVDSKKGRRAYPRLKDYIFVSLVAKSQDLDWIGLEKGQKTINESVSLLMDTMEQYINYGLSIIADKIKEDDSYFYNKNAFIDLFRELTQPVDIPHSISEDVPESLD